MLHPFATPAAEPSTSTSSFTTTNTNGSSISQEPRQYVKYLQRQVLEMKQKTNIWTSSTSSSITDTDLFIIYNADIPGQVRGI